MHDVSLYLLELLENSVRAGAGHINVGLRIDHASDEFQMTVDDDGQGLNAAPEQVLDPFFTTKEGKKTGLGLSLLRAEAEAAGGGLSIGPSPTLGGARYMSPCASATWTDRPWATWLRLLWSRR